MIHITTAMVVDGILILLAISAFLQWNKSEPGHDYTAEFGNESDHLSMFNKGVAVTGNKAITKAQSCTNVALFGPTGSGKSSTVIISSVASLARGKSSIIINDVSGEVYDRTSAYLAKKGYKILRLDFSNSRNSESFNPLLECRTISDIQKDALLIYRNSSGGETKGEIFWEQSSVMIISLFMRYLVLHCSIEFRTIQNVLRLLERFAVDTNQEVDRMFLATNDEELISSYKATLVMGEKTLQSVIASARVALNLWNDKEVCRATATNTIDFNLLRREPVALYVCNPLKDLIYFKPISALFFQSLFNYVLSRIPNKKERSIFFLLDEFAVMRFPNLSTTISNIRKYAGLLICMQDEMALVSNYGQAEAHQIKTNCGCQIYLKGQPLHTCKELSQILGKYTYREEEGGNPKTRELMTPDEIRMSEDAIILINNSAPLKCRPVPYYKNIWLKHLAKAKPLELDSTNPIDPPLIPFD